MAVSDPTRAGGACFVRRTPSPAAASHPAPTPARTATPGQPPRARGIVAPDGRRRSSGEPFPELAVLVHRADRLCRVWPCWWCRGNPALREQIDRVGRRRGCSRRRSPACPRDGRCGRGSRSRARCSGHGRAIPRPAPRRSRERPRAARAAGAYPTVKMTCAVHVHRVARCPVRRKHPVDGGTGVGVEHRHGEPVLLAHVGQPCPGASRRREDADPRFPSAAGRRRRRTRRRHPPCAPGLRRAGCRSGGTPRRTSARSPVSDAVWEAAAAAAASERPTLAKTSGLPSSAARVATRTSFSGARTPSRNASTTAVSSSLHQVPGDVHRVEPRLVPRADHVAEVRAPWVGRGGRRRTRCRRSGRPPRFRAHGSLPAGVRSRRSPRRG